jgi:hypothetical protein
VNQRRRTELLREYGLDPYAVKLWRARLDCIPPASADLIQKKRALLEKALERARDVLGKAESLDGDLASMGIPASSYLIETMSVGYQNRPLEWNPETEEWGYTEPDAPKEPLIEEYLARPTKIEALEVWNQFLIALERKPERLFRCRKGQYSEYTVEFHDARGRLLLLQSRQIRYGP